MELLIEKGSEINAKDDDGNTPLHIASYGDSFKILKSLLKHGSNVDIQNNFGDVPLFYAANHGRF